MLQEQLASLMGHKRRALEANEADGIGPRSDEELGAMLRSVGVDPRSVTGVSEDVRQRQADSGRRTVDSAVKDRIAAPEPSLPRRFAEEMKDKIPLIPTLKQAGAAAAGGWYGDGRAAEELENKKPLLTPKQASRGRCRAACTEPVEQPRIWRWALPELSRMTSDGHAEFWDTIGEATTSTLGLPMVFGDENLRALADAPGECMEAVRSCQSRPEQCRSRGSGTRGRELAAADTQRASQRGAGPGHLERPFSTTAR